MGESIGNYPQLFRIFRAVHLFTYFNANNSKMKTHHHKTRVSKLRRPQIAFSVKNLSSLIGYDNALLLSNYVRHRHFYIPKNFNPDCEVASIIGRLAYSSLHDKYAGSLVHITPSGSYHAEARRLRASGLPISKIARRFNVSADTIAAIVGVARKRAKNAGEGGIGSSSGGSAAVGKTAPKKS